MADKIRYVYDQMMNMSNTCKESAGLLDQTIARLTNMANTMEQGALLGTTGTTLVGAMRQDLLPAVDRLKQKLLEEAGDIEKNVQTMQQVDADNSQRSY